MASNKKPPQFIKLTDEDLREAGILTELPKIQEPKAGPPVKENKFTMIKIDEDYLEELRNEAKAIKVYHRPSSVSKRQSGANSIYNMKRTTTTISRRSSNVKKEITKKTISNIGNALKAGIQSNGEIKFIPMPEAMLQSLEKEAAKANVRKELFKMPMSKATLKQKYTSRTSTQLSGKFFKAPRTSIKPTITFNNSPLLEMDKVESVFKKKTTPQLHQPTPSRLSIVEEESSLSPSTSGNTSKNNGDKLRSSTSSNSEFEAMEQMCNDHEAKKVNDEIKKILGIIKKDQEEFKKYKQAYDQRMSEIATILNGIIAKTEDGKKGDNKENLKERRSKPKTPKRTPLKNGVVSNKSYDLRKNVLTMSLGNTPKEKKAERMYNNLRDKYGILETPKFDRKTPSSDGKNISERIQEQCLMLLDTPQSKK